MSVGSAFHIDVSEVRALAKTMAGADRILMDEMTTSVLKGSKIAQNEANVLIKGGNGSRLAQASDVTVRVSGKTVTGRVSWDKARSDKGFPYAASVDRGRRGFTVIRAKALRFEINGRVLYRMRVGPAKAQDFTGRGLRAAEPKILGEIRNGEARFLTRLGLA